MKSTRIATCVLCLLAVSALIARSAIPGPKLAGNNNSTGDQRVEIRLLAKAL